MSKLLSIITIFAFSLPAGASIFGEENIALAKIVVGQLEEIRQLSDALGVSKQNLQLLVEINRGVSNLLPKIDQLREIVARTRDLNPQNIKRIADLTRAVESLKEIKRSSFEILKLKVAISNQAISETAVQADTSYKVGAELTETGAMLNQEAQSASPGRAAQISASSASGSLLAHGVELQTLSKIAELQALQLEWTKSTLEDSQNQKRDQDRLFIGEITPNKNMRPSL